MDDRCDLLCLSLPRAEELRTQRIEVGIAEHAAARARGLADPTRLTIAAVLSQGGEMCVCDIAWICERSQNLISHHLRLLKGADLVSSRRDKKMVMYSLTAEGTALARVVLGAGEIVE